MNKPVFINLTNHPSKYWGEQQKKEAHKYGAIVDIPFPNVRRRQQKTISEDFVMLQ